jgi:hypothetical protein
MSAAHDRSRRVLVVGRSPGVLLEAVALLRARGYLADATNQFGSVLRDYDAGALDLLVFGGMVPPDTKARLRAAVAERNPRVRVVQGLAGIAGVIAAQVEEALGPGGAAAGAASGAAEPGAEPDAGCDIAYDSARRTVRVTLTAPRHVRVEAWWGTSFTPPEPASTSLLVRDGLLGAGSHAVPVPEHVPPVASFAVVHAGSTVRVFTVGAMPSAVTRLAPASATDRRLPDVAPVTTRSDDG